MSNSILIYFILFTSIGFSQTLEIYNTENSDIPIDNISNVTIDSNDNIWIYNSDNVYMFDQTNNEWQTYNESNSNLTSNFTHIEIRTDGSIYISSDKIFKFDNSTNNFTIVEDNINCDYFVYDNFGVLYFTSQIYVYKKSEDIISKIYDGQVDGPNYPSNLIIDSDNTLWFGIDGFSSALYNYKNNELITHDSIYIANGRLKSKNIRIDKENQIWQNNGDDAIVFNYNKNNNYWSLYNENNSPLGEKHSFSKSFTVDNNDNLWLISSIGTTKQPIKLMKFDNSEWLEFRIDKLLGLQESDEMLIYNINTDSKNNVWIASDRGLIRFNENTTSVANTTSDKIKIYPNPAKTQLNFDLGGEVVKSITITDLSGKDVVTYNSDLSNLNSIDISALVTGQYFISFELTDQSVINKKFVKE